MKQANSLGTNMPLFFSGYDVKTFSGTKSVVLSTTSVLGGKNSFLVRLERSCETSLKPVEKIPAAAAAGAIILQMSVSSGIRSNEYKRKENFWTGLVSSTNYDLNFASRRLTIKKLFYLCISYGFVVIPNP